MDLGDRGDALPGPPPVPWLADVTQDERYTGGRLAGTNEAALRHLLQPPEQGVRHP